MRFLIVTCLASFASAETLERAAARYLAATEEAPLETPWTVSGTFALAKTDGNSDTLTVSTGVDAARDWERWRLALKLTSLYAESDDEQSANEHILTERLDYKLDEKQSLFQMLLVEHDDEEGLKYRVLFTLGYERLLRKTDRFELKGDVGGGVLHEEYRDESNTEATAQAGLSISWKITDRLTYTGRVLFWPSLSESGEFRAMFLNTFETPVSERMSLRVEVNDKYNSNAPAGTEKNDFILLVGIKVAFTKPA